MKTLAELSKYMKDKDLTLVCTTYVDVYDNKYTYIDKCNHSLVSSFDPKHTIIFSGVTRSEYKTIPSIYGRKFRGTATITVDYELKTSTGNTHYPVGGFTLNGDKLYGNGDIFEEIPTFTLNKARGENCYHANNEYTRVFERLGSGDWSLRKTIGKHFKLTIPLKIGLEAAYLRYETAETAQQKLINKTKQTK